jgi:CubicO group peptidase (beta-lactamase class C family)
VAKSRTHTILALIVTAIGLLVAAILGLFAYVSMTAVPLHPDAQKVPTLTRSTPLRQWTAAVEQARQFARADLTEQNLPGLSVAVGVNGDIVWAEGFGYADLERKTVVNPNVRFRIGNVSNPLTAAAVGLLLEKHELNLDDEIQKYVPAFPKKPWPVTVRQLMGQVSGVRNDEGDEEPLLERCEQTADGIRRFANDKLRFQPGTKYSPSSYGWILVSAAVEAAGYQPFFTFMRTKIFEPLGMAATRPDSWMERIPDRVTFYFPRFGGDNRYGPELAREGDYSCFAGAGAFLSTPSDLVRFGMAFTGGKLLQPETVTLLQTSQRLASGEETGYGLGWKLETVSLASQPTRMASHGVKADFIGTTASLLTFPDRGLVVAVTSNTSFGDTAAIGLRIAHAFAEQGRRPANK